MASKYGQQLYGRDLYSSAFGLLEGTISFAFPDTARLTESEPIDATMSFAWTLTGPLTESEPFDGTFSFTFGMSSIFTKAHPLVGGIPFSVTLTGIRTTNFGLYGGLPFNFDMTGILFRAGEREFEAHLDVIVNLMGGLSITKRMSADLISFYIDIEGGADIYIGDFWKPNVPIEGGWVPDSSGGTIWEPIPRGG